MRCSNCHHCAYDTDRNQCMWCGHEELACEEVFEPELDNTDFYALIEEDLSDACC